MINNIKGGIPLPQDPSQASSGNPELDEKFREVASMYEKQFLREMMKTMRTTVQDSGLVKVSQGEQIFREQLDQEYVEKWGDKGGIGLSDLIYDQLLFHYGPKNLNDKPQGPLSLDERKQFQLSKSEKSSPTTTTMEFKKLPTASAEPTQLLMPWDGKITKKLSLGPDETFLEMWHSNGFKSRMSVKGVLDPIEIGKNLQKGEGLGYLSPETKNFVWNVSL